MKGDQIFLTLVFAVIAAVVYWLSGYTPVIPIVAMAVVVLVARFVEDVLAKRVSDQTSYLLQLVLFVGFVLGAVSLMQALFGTTLAFVLIVLGVVYFLTAFIVYYTVEPTPATAPRR